MASKTKPTVSFPYKQTTQATVNIKDMLKQLQQISQPGLESGIKSIEDLIATGGAGTNVPLISQAVAGMTTAGERAMAGTEESLARGGVTGDLAQSIRGPIQNQLSTQIQGFGPQVALPYIQAAAQAGLTGGQQGILTLAGSAIHLGKASALAQKREQAGTGGAGSFGKNLGRALTDPDSKLRTTLGDIFGGKGNRVAGGGGGKATGGGDYAGSLSNGGGGGYETFGSGGPGGAGY